MSIINKDNSSTCVELVGLSNADVNRAAQLTNLVMRFALYYFESSVTSLYPLVCHLFLLSLVLRSKP